MILFFKAKYGTRCKLYSTVLYHKIYYYFTAVYIFGSIYRHGYGKGTVAIVQFIVFDSEISYGRNILQSFKKKNIYRYV